MAIANTKAPVSEIYHLGFIDGLRGMAILWVILHHSFYFFKMKAVLHHTATLLDQSWMAAAFTVGAKTIYTIASHGFFGVNLFFVISGFLITGLLMEFIEGKLDIGRFYLRRIFKIIPHYYFVILVVVVGLLITNPLHKWLRIGGLALPDLFFLQNYIVALGWIDQTWSLVVEEQFYIFWSLFLFVISKVVVVDKNRWQAAVFMAGVVVILVNINRYCFYHYGISLIYMAPMKTHLTHTSSIMADGLMLGCILRLLWFRYPSWFKEKGLGWGFYALGAVCFLLLLLTPVSSWGVPNSWTSPLLVSLFSLLFITAGLKGFYGIWQTPWLCRIGKNSYGIYLVHYPVYIALSRMSAFSAGGYLPFIGCILLAIFLGGLTTVTVEKYFLDMRHRYFP